MRTLSRMGQILLLMGGVLLTFYEIFLPNTALGRFAIETMILPMLCFMGIGLIEIAVQRKAASPEDKVTFEEFYLKEKARFKRTLVAAALFLAVMIPFGFYGSPDGRLQYFSVILGTILTGMVVSWIAYDEVKKAHKGAA